MDFKLTDHSEEVLEELVYKKKAALEAIGITAEGYAKKKCPVDTGRLRNSITYATKERENCVIPFKYTEKIDGKKVQITDTTVIGSGVGDDEVYIGTNVEYAAYVELGTVNTGAQPYLKPAATGHSNKYKKIIEMILKE